MFDCWNHIYMCECKIIFKNQFNVTKNIWLISLTKKHKIIKFLNGLEREKRYKKRWTIFGLFFKLIHFNC
jgi:hypothetical protein